MARLIVRKGRNIGSIHDLSKDIVTIGRDENCGIRINTEGVSRNHAQLVREGDRWILTDLMSKNGTVVNGEKVGEHKLESGDEVSIGDEVMVFQGEQAAPEEPAPPPAQAAPSRATSSGDDSAYLAGDDLEVVKRMKKGREAIEREVAKVIIGQRQVVEQVIIALFCRGHGLIEGVPGLAKTLLVRTIAQVLELDFKRIQFTPDLMPSDITGTEVLEEASDTRERYFKFLKGPIFSNVLLADEINRTPPKTQAALLEAMQEYRVTAGGETYELDLPFFVLATQNPIEQEGTYPLPEAQLDRFMFHIKIGYPEKTEEVDIVLATTKDVEAEPKPVMSGDDIRALQSIVRRVPVSRHVATYAAALARATRPKTEEAPGFVNEWLAWGAGPRAAQYLVLGAKAHAVLRGRVNVACEDIRAMAPPVMRHRLFTNFNADSEGVSVEDIIERIVRTVPEPSEKDYR
jgi:MoxR-like ATPase